VAVGTLAFGTGWLRSSCDHEWHRYRQPDGDHAIVVYRCTQRFALMGQAGDAPGVVKLVHGQGRVEQTTSVEMVQDVSEPEWSPGHVNVKLIADWTVKP
jgi:hypothetical protein